MSDYSPSTYGDAIASRYDTWFPDVDPVMINRLAELAGHGTALELGIGTGRVALPLSERGVQMHGIEASEGMLGLLRGKPGGNDIPVTVGDFSRFEFDTRFGLVFVVNNTLFALLSQDAQVQCFKSVAGVLAAGGKFAIEAFVPDPGRFEYGQSVLAHDVLADSVKLDVCTHDAVAQTVASQVVEFSTDGTRLYPLRIRYCWPSELDLMAELAGLTLVERWGGWHGEPFTSDSVRHVSVYAGS